VICVPDDPIHHSARGRRGHETRRFRIYFDAEVDEIVVIRVFHLKRDRKTLFKRRR
jgi:plasmid stabilization system protein ParE